MNAKKHNAICRLLFTANPAFDQVNTTIEQLTSIYIYIGAHAGPALG